MKKIFTIFFYLFLMLFTGGQALGQNASISTELRAQLNDRSKQSKLYFPKSVKQYYVLNRLQPCWINDKAREQHTFQAMLLLDCVLQYGLAHADYHPDALIYERLQTMLNEPEKITVEQRVNFDIFLTDAIITLINHLHYGKLNPDYSARRIDGKAKIMGFSAVTELIKANREEDFMTILNVQPRSKAYVELQHYMRLIKGQYVGDCYQVPESEVRKVAINMERLRWWEFGGTKAHRSGSPYLTCKIKDGLPVFYKDTEKLDPLLEAEMYHLDGHFISKPKKPVTLPNIKLKKD